MRAGAGACALLLAQHTHAAAGAVPSPLRSLPRRPPRGTADRRRPLPLRSRPSPLPHTVLLSRHAQSGPRARAVTPCTAPAVRFEAEDPRAQAKALGPRSALPPTRGGASRPPSSSLPHPARMHRRGGAGGEGRGRPKDALL